MAFSPTRSAALRYWNMARQRYCRRLARSRNTLCVSADPGAKPTAHSRAESPGSWSSKAERERDGLSAGGRWIRTIGTSPNFFGRPSIPAQFTFRNINRLPRDRNRWFKSISLQRRVANEPDPRRAQALGCRSPPGRSEVPLLAPANGFLRFRRSINLHKGYTPRRSQDLSAKRSKPSVRWTTRRHCQLNSVESTFLPPLS